MLDKTAIKRVTDERDPNRCQAGSATHGQCINVSTPGTKYCIVHSGSNPAESIKGLRNYRLTQYNVRAGELRNNSGIKDLRDEIAILRMTLEHKMNAFENDGQMILQSGAISELILKIEKLVTACHKLEKEMGVTIEKSIVVGLADNIVTIINKHVTDKAIVENILVDIQAIFRKKQE